MRLPANEKIQWNCHVTGADDLTVGTEFVLTCSGSEVPFAGDGVFVMTASGDPFQLKLLRIVKGSGTELEAIVTSYRPGDGSSQSYLLTDGRQQVELKNVSFIVKSVIQGQQEPYPRFPPWVMTLPIWFWLGFASAVLVSLAAALWKLHIRKENKKLMAEALSYKTNRPAVDEFYKELRQLEKLAEKEQLSVTSQVSEFEKIFRLYLTRHFEIPAHVWSFNRSWKELKRSHPKLVRKEGARFETAIMEMAKVKSVTLSEKDLKQLIQMISKVIEAIQMFEKQNARSIR